MTPIVFINTKEVPFVDLIISGKKWIESRNKPTLHKLVGGPFGDGCHVMIAETGHGKPVVRCSAHIMFAQWAFKNEWEDLRGATCVPVGSKYDIGERTKKCLYYISDVKPVEPFVPPEGKRHGRVWMEFEEE